MKILTTLVLCFSMSLIFVACEDDGCVPFAEEFQTELNNITEADNAYDENKTPENCDHLKDAFNDFIDALEEWELCAEELNQEEARAEALEEARDNADSVC